MEKGGVRMTLDEVRCGMVVRLGMIEEKDVRMQALRLGLMEGEVVTCTANVWAGAVVLERGGQEFAVGRRLAERIRVWPVWHGGGER